MAVTCNYSLTYCAIKNGLFDAIYRFLVLIVFFAIIAALCDSLRYRFKHGINNWPAIADESFSEILGFRSVGARSCNARCAGNRKGRKEVTRYQFTLGVRFFNSTTR